MMHKYLEQLMAAANDHKWAILIAILLVVLYVYRKAIRKQINKFMAKA